MPRCLPTVGIGPDVELAPVGQVAEAVPRLLAVHHEVVADRLRPAPQRRQVRSGVGLGHALGPDLVAAQHRPQEAALLLIGAVGHDRRRDVRDADHVDRTGRGAPVHLLEVDELLVEVGVASTVVGRPRRRRPTRVGQAPVPVPQDVEVLVGGRSLPDAITAGVSSEARNDLSAARNSAAGSSSSTAVDIGLGHRPAT